MTTNTLPPPNSKPARIEAIDVLRAFVLLGILLVHTSNNGYGFGQPLPTNTFESTTEYSIAAFLTHKCVLTFNLLFGLSFYLMLRNPLNSSKKFVWRCFLLVLIGVLNKFFYSNDILMWYGLCGMLLTPFRRLSARNLFIISLALFIFNTFWSSLINIYDYIPGYSFPPRYYPGASIFDIISYPIIYAVIVQFGYLLASGPFELLAISLLGYSIGKSGIIEHLNDYIHLKTLIISWAILICVIFVRLKLFPAIVLYEHLLTSLTYAYTILFLFCKTGLRKYMLLLSPYGKMGLTNYSMQGIVMVTCFSAIGLNLAFASYTTMLLFAIAFYIFQATFSYLWLRGHRYGPYEWVWRCATERRLIPNRKATQSMAAA